MTQTIKENSTSRAKKRVRLKKVNTNGRQDTTNEVERSPKETRDASTEYLNNKATEEYNHY